MKRRKFIKNSAASAAIGVLIPSSITQSYQDSKNCSIAHYVLFWLKETLSENEKKDFTKFFEELKKVPTIKSLHYGSPANTNQRDVVDNSFSYNLLVYFENMDDLNVYETHPIHLNAVEKYSKYWEKVVVHDSILNGT
jgi:hypothetical protein